MEDLLASLSEVGKADYDKKGQGIDGSHGPKPIRSIGNKMEVSHRRVDLQSIIGTGDEDIHFDGLGEFDILDGRLVMTEG